MERKMERCGGKKERRLRDKRGSQEVFFFFIKSAMYFFGLITPPLCSHLSLPPFAPFKFHESSERDGVIPAVIEENR